MDSTGADIKQTADAASPKEIVDSKQIEEYRE